MQSFKCFLLILLILTIGSCKPTTTNGISKQEITNTGTGELIPINFSDTNYIDLRLYAKDTTTANGWSIQYLVKDDSTQYKDLYIMCSKGKVKAIHRLENVLDFRRYFIPEFKAETTTNIFFTHGCATDCLALLVFNKDEESKFSDYKNVIKYNVSLGQILYVTDGMYQHEEEIYELALVDVARDKTHNLKFDGICDGVYKPSCVDTVIFSNKQVSVTVSLRRSIEDIDPTKQTKEVRL